MEMHYQRGSSRGALVPQRAKSISDIEPKTGLFLEPSTLTGSNFTKAPGETLTTAVHNISSKEGFPRAINPICGVALRNIRLSGSLSTVCFPENTGEKKSRGRVLQHV